jgi:hypothetical protein
MFFHAKYDGESSHLSEEEKKAVVLRCFRMVDYVSDVVTNYILDFVQNVTCLTAKQFLLSKPEEFAIRAFLKAINDIAHPSRESNDRVH